ncbi:MAG: GNAT family N-acetyltransferase [Actinobacteria bacterium]|nr:GNAT family N-acetyltransferase [Actinomycetota bacterium]MDA3017209.1 GNAT family N-acetyltransferase [Actinomycetota bacterium]
MISDFLQNSGVLLPTHSRVESERFGIDVARLNIPIDSPASDIQIARICNESSADILILRYPSTRNRLAQSLADLSKAQAFQADTLVYFSKDLVPITESSKTNYKWKLSIASPNDNSIIKALSQIIFQDYPNHYRSNHRLGSQSIVDGYVEWASFGLADSAKLTVIVETPDSKKIGFALVSFDENGAEIELNGVHPKFHNQGVYSVLLQMLMGYLANQKIDKLSISTQIQNTRAIRAWVKAGFNLEFSLNTFHIMPRY